MHVSQFPYHHGNPVNPKGTPYSQNAAVSPQLDGSEAVGTPSTSMFVSTKNNILLQTARAHVSCVGAPGSTQNIRMIFDSCIDWEEDQSHSKTGLPQVNPEEEFPKVLGVSWNIKCDKLVFSFDGLTIYLTEESVTKRIVLSSITKVYDPLRILSPITTVLKILFQVICKDKGIT